MTNTTSAHVRIAAEVRAELARRRIPQASLAEALGISQVGVSRRLRGETPFDVNELVAVADFLGVTVASLYGEPAA